MSDETNLQSGLCDRCDVREGGLVRLAREVAGPAVITEAGRWTGGWSPKKAEVWRAAIAEAERRLTKPLVEVFAEHESVSLCRGCVSRLLAEFPEPGREASNV